MSVIRIRKRRFYTIIAVAFVTAIIVVVFNWRYVIIGWLASPPRSTVEMPATSYNILRAGGTDVVAFRHISPTDSILLGVDVSSSTVSYADAGDTLWQDDALCMVVIKTRAAIEDRLDAFESMEKEIRYFLEHSGVQDEGYDVVLQYASAVDSLRRQYRTVLDKLQTVRNGTSLSVINIPTSASTCGKPLFVESMGGLWCSGRWVRTMRNANGIGCDSIGRWIIGHWAADTVVTGHRTDSIGVYRGQFDRSLMASGHGTLHSIDGVFYQGQFADDRIDGFCIALDRSRLRIGEWIQGKYRGQKLNFTTERIYGIDISRYQHGKGRKYLPIQWKKLRISSLGTISKKRVTGIVDYPVSFIYIKSTEGVSVRNKYYAADSRAARANGLRIGAYHFFSTKSSGASQANFFLRHSTFRQGDMPPVLDVEPTDAQIAKMGGTGALFASVRSWLCAVEKRVGVRPVLYVSQRFVNRYLDQAPDIKHDYNIWIARYGEYKPDVHLVFWQLCPDGRVRGITGDVDVNVFNGYSQQFKQFLQDNCVK